MLGAFKAIDEVDTSDIQPAFHPRQIENEWREDEVSEVRWDPLAEIKSKEGGYYKGPRIV